jgi:IS5 family transposase
MKQKRESRYVTIARMAYHLAKAEMPLYSHPKSPHRFTQPQLTACVMLAFYLNLSYRAMEEWLLATDQICAVLELKEIPDHTTLARMMHRLTQARLSKMLHRFLQQLEELEETVAIDATGFRLTQASAYYLTRSNRTYRHWVKGVYVVGTRSQYILAWASGTHQDHDIRFLAQLKRDVARYGRRKNGKRAWVLLGDSGFDAAKLSDKDLIPPIRRGGRLVNKHRRARADLVSQARLDGVFGQRWKTETVHSVIKRLFGDTIRSRSHRLQLREPILLALLYNLHR